MANYLKPVVFKSNGQMFGVDINLVQSIEQQINVVPVPNSVSFIRGIISLRGEVVPVYNLKKKFSMQDDKPSHTAIIISASDVKIALEVDQVVEIDNIEPENIFAMPPMIKKEDTQYLDRVASVDKQLVILLDVEKLLSETEAADVKKLSEEMSDKQQEK